MIPRNPHQQPEFLKMAGSSQDYELLDSGDGEKLERFGKYVVSRPDPQVLWPKQSPKSWDRADAFFRRSAERSGWQFRNKIPARWEVSFGDLRLWVKLTSFKHTGVFPEQQSNWQWLDDVIRKADRKVSVINLFGYTGGATLAAARSGAEVCHVDSSKVAVTWARENAELSGLAKKPVRWIVDDALVFLRREIKRGRKYDGIIMDPPIFGHGPNKELWKIEKDWLDLFGLAQSVLSNNPLFWLVSGYAAGYSHFSYRNNFLSFVEKYKGVIDSGELILAHAHDARILPAGIFVRWSKHFV